MKATVCIILNTADPRKLGFICDVEEQADVSLGTVGAACRASWKMLFQFTIDITEILPQC